MPPEITTDRDVIDGWLEPVLASDPVRHTVLATILGDVRAGIGAPWCAREPGSGAFVVRSGAEHPFLVLDAWTDVGALADAILAVGELRAVGGAEAHVEPLADALVERGAPPPKRMRERLFRLNELHPPAVVDGAARLASSADVKTVADVLVAFHLEAMGFTMLREEAVRQASERRTSARDWLWEVDGELCAMAGVRPPTNGVGRVGPVYTPPARRGRGYGSAVTAVATQDILDAGGTPVLFTDVSNATSNHIYQTLGYRPLENRIHLQFR